MLKFVMTCGACPEQYDAFLDGEQVGYLRLRHGHFSVECPDSGGTEVYAAKTKGDGLFYEDERDFHLSMAARAILNDHGSERYAADGFMANLISGKAKLTDVDDYVDRWHRDPVGTRQGYLGLDEEEWVTFVRTGEVILGARYEVVDSDEDESEV